MQTWRNKANREIARMCAASYRQANTLKSGKLRKRHIPYSVPEVAQDLIDCLNTDDEHRAKSIFVWKLL